MTRLTIHHETRYSYERPVRFSQHRLLLRPRDSHALRVIEARLSLSPPGETRWVYDALGNCVCLFEPGGEARSLIIVSRLVTERFPAPLSPDDPGTGMPVAYGLEDRTVLAPFIAPATEADGGALQEWLRSLTGAPGEPALDLLMRMTGAIHQGFEYRERQVAGVQTPGQTLRLRSGACRDFAWLMIEALRRLGFAARFVSGYVNGGGARRGAGATHAWVDVFLPDLGWTEFDPTNGLAESADLIRIAVARTPREAAPVSGAILGDPGRAELTVGVMVSSETAAVAA
ncbi:MAG TPA: transglutaminase family protein [Caulobacter sp.]|nr:transglutaminase family protein [Caulobacter sp.]